MDGKRITIGLITPIFLIFLRWITTYAVHRIWRTIQGTSTCDFNAKKTLARGGWDLSSVSAGIFVAALLDSSSAVGELQNWAGPGYGNFIILAVGLLFLALHCPAIVVRYNLLEDWAMLSPEARLRWGLLGWLVGWVSIQAALGLASRV